MPFEVSSIQHDIERVGVECIQIIHRQNRLLKREPKQRKMYCCALHLTK